MIEIKAEHPNSDVAIMLINKLDQALSSWYETEPGEYKSHNLLAADTPFFVAWLDGDPAGCGAYRPMDDDAIEVKRMYVSETARRKGVGRAILTTIENEGKAAGYKITRLGTGFKQAAAIAMYEKVGYTRIPNWPPYDELPDRFVCMEKMLK